MNKLWKKAWIGALRSGLFKQGKYRMLHQGDDGDTFCCLGVLATIQGMDLKNDTSAGKSAPFSQDSEYNAGLSFGEQCRLSSMNDHKSSFSEIADFIEKEL